MTTVIKNGTIVTADLTYKADVKIDGGKIVEIGPNLSGDETLDATGCYVMPGGIDPHVHLEMPFMGTYSSDDFESGTRAGLAGGTTMVVDFCLPSPGQSLLEALQMWDNKSTRANCGLFLPHGDHLVGRTGVRRDGDCRQRERHQHLQALHGLQGRIDGG
jgi:dihydropyrimidinase